MAKKELNEDMLAGGTLAGKDSKEAKKAEKIKKQKEKLAAKKADIKAEIDKLKAEKADTDDEAKKAELEKQIKKLVDKYNAVGSSNGKGVAPNTAKAIKAAVCIVLVVAILVTYVSTGLVRNGFVSYLGIPAKTLTAAVVSGNGNKQKIDVGTYNFYYAKTFNGLRSSQSQYAQYKEQYGLDLDSEGISDVDFSESLAKQEYTDPETKEKSNWAKHLDQLVLDTIEQTYTYYLEAVKANNGKDPEITEDQQKELDELVEEYTKTAHSYNFTLSGYLTKAMGHGVTDKLFIRELTRQYIAENYQQELNNKATSTEFSKEDYNNYKKEHKEELTTVDIKLFECDNEDVAKKFKSELATDGSNFAELASKYAESDFYKEAYKEDGYTTLLGMSRNDLINRQYAIAAAEEKESEKEGEEHEHAYPGLDWLFSSKRQAGDAYQYSTTVVYVIKPASISDRKTINVRHILITPDSELEANKQTTADTKKWAEAEKKAKKILKDWKSGEKTEDSFAALAKDNSSDGSASTGGLYENVVTGQMVDSFSAWCFDTSRKTGDTAIVKTDYGYHIMYFVGNGSQPIWQYQAQQSLGSDKGSDEVKKLEDAYTVKSKWFGTRYTLRDLDLQG